MGVKRRRASVHLWVVTIDPVGTVPVSLKLASIHTSYILTGYRFLIFSEYQSQTRKCVFTEVCTWCMVGRIS